MFIQQTWPTKCNHWEVLLTILIKALYNEDKMGEQPNKDNIMVIVECIQTLEAVRPQCTRGVLNELKGCKEFQSKTIFIEHLKQL